MASVQRVGLLLPVAALIGGLMFAVMGVAWFAAGAQDRQAVASTRHTVRSVLQANHRELGGWASDYSFWDDFVEKVVVTIDDTWADDNIGLYAHENLGVDITLVVDISEKAYIVSLAEDLDLSIASDPVSTDIAALADAARGATGEPGVRPVSKLAFVEIDNRIFMAAASPAKWEGEAPRPNETVGLSC